MAIIISVSEVQDWLQNTKYQPSNIDDGLRDIAVNTILGKLAQRYDTSTWTTNSTTPSLVVNILTMLYASYYLQRVISEEDGQASYAIRLEERASTLCAQIVDGSISLPGFEEDETTSLGGGIEFFPTDASTLLWEETKGPDGSSLEEGASARAFTMEQRF